MFRCPDYRDDPRAWTRASLSEADWRLPVPEACVAEVDAVLAHLARHPLPLLLLDAADYSLDACRELFAEVGRRLLEGSGVVLLDRFPVERWGREGTELAFWLLGQLAGRPVVQTFDGKIMVEVTDTGVKKAVGVRGFRTNAGQNPHVDNSFNHAPPDLVSLICLQGARAGGVSRFISFYSVHNRLRADCPELLERLYEPFYQDRQGDFWPDEPQTVSYPVFEPGEGLRCRYTHFTIPAGYRTAGVPFEGRDRAAFETMSRVIEDPELYCEFEMRPGEMQLVNNRTCGHGRTEFIDDPAQPRMLLRLWHRNWGGRGYSAE